MVNSTYFPQNCFQLVRFSVKLDLKKAPKARQEKAKTKQVYQVVDVSLINRCFGKFSIKFDLLDATDALNLELLHQGHELLLEVLLPRRFAGTRTPVGASFGVARDSGLASGNKTGSTLFNLVLNGLNQFNILRKNGFPHFLALCNF